MDQDQRSGAVRLRPRAAGTSVSRLIDAFTPVGLQQAAPEERRRARILVSALLIHVLMCLATLAIILAVLPAASVRSGAAAVLVALSVLLAMPVALARKQLVLGANVLLVSGFAVLMVGTVMFGDMRVQLLHWFALLPMLAIMMGSLRSALGWSGVGIGVAGLVTWLAPSGALPALDPLPADGPLQRARELFDVALWIGIWAGVALVYERTRREADIAPRPVDRRLSRVRTGAGASGQESDSAAGQDALTRLPHRRELEERLAEAMRVAEIEGRQVAVLFLDLDGFKQINEQHGHDLGDRLLQHVARRLSNCVRGADALSRGRELAEEPVMTHQAGDEFTVLLSSIRGHEEAAVVARRIQAALRRPVDLEGHEVSISASVGIAMYPGDVQDAESLLRNADLAMYYAKERGKNNFQFFDASLNDAAQRRAARAGDLRLSLARGELYLAYQPIVDAASHDIVSLEALLRWRHPSRGVLAPEDFIHIAEEFGLSTQIGDFVLDEACHQWRRWRDAGVRAPRLSINVSAAQLRQRDFSARVARALERYGMQAKSLELEITENAIMEDEEEASRSLHAAKELGVRVALDDFGTGYSSLSYVKRFPVDAIKIDRSFAGEVAEDPEARAITSAIVALAHELDLTVVAEGVETEAQADYLTSLRCEALQGYFFSRPQPPEALEDLLGAVARSSS